MKVDLYFGVDTDKIFGMNRCKLELWKGLNLDKKKIAYKPKNRILNFFDFLTYMPYITFKERRKDAIAHILSQSESHVLNFFKFKKSVVLAYDIIPLTLGYVSYPSLLKSKLAYRGMKKADHIIAISQFTKDELVKHLQIPEDKITVAYIGVNHDKYKPIEHLTSTRNKYNLSKENKYLIYVGNEEPRMNLDTLLKAFKQAKEKIPNLKLIKVGGANFPKMRGKLKEEIKKLQLQDEIIFTGYVPEDDLPLLYNVADIAVYLCNYAGFGLPPAESMACGTPTIGAKASSIVEVIQDGGLMLDPRDPEEISKAIVKILKEPKYSEELSKNGIRQAKKFTWEHFIQTTKEVYKKL